METRTIHYAENLLGQARAAVGDRATGESHGGAGRSRRARTERPRRQSGDPRQRGPRSRSRRRPNRRGDSQTRTEARGARQAAREEVLVCIVFLDSHEHSPSTLMQFTKLLWEPALSKLTRHGLVLIDVGTPDGRNSEFWPPQPPDEVIKLPASFDARDRDAAIRDIAEIALEEQGMRGRRGGSRVRAHDARGRAHRARCPRPARLPARRDQGAVVLSPGSAAMAGEALPGDTAAFVGEDEGARTALLALAAAESVTDALAAELLRVAGLEGERPELFIAAVHNAISSSSAARSGARPPVSGSRCCGCSPTRRA